MEFHPRLAIKEQARTDFLVEASRAQEGESGEEIEITPTLELSHLCWKIFVDVASGKELSGARVLLKSPKGLTLSYPLRFLSPPTNNVAE